MNPLRRPVAERGFSLIEVMVSLIVISAGLLGVAKMQALALASTSIANMRSMAAIEAASLASAMHEDRGYWGSAAPAAAGGIVVTYTGISSSGAKTAPTITALTASTDCAAAVCDGPTLAAYDLQQWALALQQVLPNYVATITCTTGSPVTCTINVNWTEKVISLMSAGANVQASPNYTLYVQP